MERFVLWHRAALPSTDEALAATEVASWTRSVALRLREAGGEWLGSIGGTTVAAFDLPDMTLAIEQVLWLLEELERAKKGALADLRVAFGCAVGDVEVTTGPDDRTPVHFGEALDRAQVLAGTARRGQVLFDETARELASTTYLFGPSIAVPGRALRGHPIDRRIPRLSACRAALAKLSEAIPPERLTRALEPIGAAARERGVHRFALRGGSGSGALEALGKVLAAARPIELLRLGVVPGALEPLGSLRLALLRRFGDPASVSVTLPPGQAPFASVLGQIARGEPIPQKLATDAMRALLGRPRDGAAKACILVDPLSVDADTLKLVDALADGAIDLLLVVRASADARLPRPFAPPPEGEIRVPLLKPDEALEVARGVVGLAADPDIAEVVAVHGGDSPLGILEAARTLVSSGDLVHDGARFQWRLAARAAESRIPLRLLLDERLRAVEPIASRMLEVVCVAPFGFPPHVLHRTAALDGLDEESRLQSIAALRQEAFLADDRELRPSSEAVRAMVLRSMPPARLAELHRFLAAAIEEDIGPGTLVRATTGFLRGEGGDTEVGALSLLEAAAAATRAGHERSAVRLAATAVQCHPSNEVRAAASRVTHAVGAGTPVALQRPARTNRPVGAQTMIDLPAIPAPSERAGEGAIKALLARDFERVDRLIETAIAEGRSLAAADRLRSMALLARGDRPGAREAYARALSNADDDPKHVARMALVESFLLLDEGDAPSALRPALHALSIARRLRDPVGEAAAMRTVACCYRALGREENALAIREAAPD